MKMLLLGILIGPFVWMIVAVVGYYIGRLMWNIRPKDPIEGPNWFWGSFSVFDKKLLDEN